MRANVFAERFWCYEFYFPAQEVFQVKSKFYEVVIVFLPSLKFNKEVYIAFVLDGAVSFERPK